MHAHLKVKKQNVILIDHRSKSFVKAFVGLMARQWSLSDVVIQDTSGAERTEDAASYFCYCPSPGGYGKTINYSYSGDYTMESDRRGVVIGSDDTAVAPDDYNLDVQIRSGEKTGTIYYCGTGVHGLTTEDTGDTGSFKILGIFKNVSGASIDVKEVGVYASGLCASASYPDVYNYCILRDNITTISLADGEYLEVEYTISIAA